MTYEPVKIGTAYEILIGGIQSKEVADMAAEALRAGMPSTMTIIVREVETIEPDAEPDAE